VELQAESKIHELRPVDDSQGCGGSNPSVRAPPFLVCLRTMKKEEVWSQMEIVVKYQTLAISLVFLAHQYKSKSCKWASQNVKSFR